MASSDVDRAFEIICPYVLELGGKPFTAELRSLVDGIIEAQSRAIIETRAEITVKAA